MPLMKRGPLGFLLRVTFDPGSEIFSLGPGSASAADAVIKPQCDLQHAAMTDGAGLSIHKYACGLS